MAGDGELPRWLAAVSPRTKVPHRAELTVGAIVAATVALVDLRGAIAWSSFGVLTYYAVANASAWTLEAAQRRWPRWLAGLGVAGCGLLAFTLPRGAVLGGIAVLAVGALARLVRTRTGAR